MKDKAAVIVLIVVAIGLGVGLVVVNQHSQSQHKEDADHITVLSNDLMQAKATETDLQQVNQTLQTNLAAARLDLSNKLALSDANLHSLEANLDKAQAEAKAQAAADAAAIAQRDKKIAGLEQENQGLDKEAADLRASITNLNAQIATTQKALEQATGDRSLLLSELKQLQARKDNLEAMFNNLAVVRERVRELKHQFAEARRLDWIRHGAYAQLHEKGGERLIAAHEPAPTASNASYNIVLKQHGAPAITPLPSNSPAAK